MGLSALVITADLEARKVFKETFPAISQFDRIQYSCSLTEGSQKLDGTDPIDVIMVSSRFSGDVISQFIATCKRKPCGSASAYVLLFDMRESSVEEMLLYPTESADGFLFEPYTVTDVKEQIDIARAVNAERARQNTQLAIDRHIARVLSIVDEVAEKFRGVRPPKHVLGASRGTIRFLEALSDENRQEYFERLAARASERPPAEPRKIPDHPTPKAQSRAIIVRRR